MSADEASVLFANDAFYHAFATGDADAMDDVWSHDAPVTCIHPGAGLMSGRMEVMESWRAILAGSGTNDIHAADAGAHVVGDMAWVTCLEVVGGGALAATNVFVREGKAWKLVHHQAGPTNAEPQQTTDPTPMQ